jgi:hypothetical protein
MERENKAVCDDQEATGRDSEHESQPDAWGFSLKSRQVWAVLWVMESQFYDFFKFKFK